LVEAVEVAVPEGVEGLFEGVEPYGVDFYHDARLAAKLYLRFIVKERRATKQRLQHAYTAWGRGLLKEYMRDVVGLEELLLRLAEERMGMHPVWRWTVECVGLKERTALVLVGFINPYEASSAGKVWAYWGLTPESKLRRGEKARCVPWLKGAAYMLSSVLVMRGHPYYRTIYDAKKDYYLNVRGFKEYIEDPSRCPNYAECLEKLARRARRLGRKPKKPACKAHVDGMAKRFMVKVLLSHAWEISRITERLPVPRHRNYIRPCRSPDDTPDPEVLERIRKGIV